MSAPLAPLDRRHRRRAETIEQVIDIAIAVMGEVGVAGLSLGEVARRMGMRTPSLCGYFATKNDVYDAVFSAAGGSCRPRCPVPGYHPSAQAYACAVEALERGRVVLAELQRLGLFRPDVTVDELLRTWTVLLNGVMTQQLANAPKNHMRVALPPRCSRSSWPCTARTISRHPRRGCRADNR